MQLVISFLVGLIASVGGYFGYQATQGESLGAFGDPFISIQLADSPQAGYVLSTDGTENEWILNTGGGGGGGFPTYFQNDGATLNVATTTVNFTANSFSVVESPADTLTIRVATTTLGLLTTNVTEGSNLYYTTARVSNYITSSTTLCVALTGSAALCDGADADTTYTAGDALTLTGNDIDFDGGASPSGDLGGTWASPSVTDDSHAHTGATLSGIDISSDTNLSADGTEIVLTGDALSLGTALTFTTGTSTTSFFSGLGYFTNLVATTLATFLNVVVTGLLDVGDGVLEIPNGTGPTVDAAGEIAFDTSDEQLIVGASANVVPTQNVKIWSATIASTSPALINGGLLKVPTMLDGYTMTAIRCSVQSGTSQVIAVEDESTNSTEDITCTTSVTSDDGSITNATVTAAEEMYIDFGATTGAVDYVAISVFGDWSRE